MRKKAAFQPSDLLPLEWQGAYCVMTEEDLLFMGSRNLNVLWKWWIGHAHKLYRTARNMQAKLYSCADVLPQSQLDQINTERLNMVAEWHRAEDKVEYLEEIMQKAEDKPLFTNYRPTDYFLNGEKVRIFTSQGERILPETTNIFVQGRVIDQDKPLRAETATTVTEKPFHNGDFGEGCKGVFGTSRPEILPEWEYSYLRQHPDYLEVWLHSAEVENRGFDAQRFTEALML